MSLKFNPDKAYVMPVFFGPTWMQQQPFEGGKGMRDHFQPGEVNVASLTYETDADVLEAMIPDCYTLNDPFVNVSVCEFTNLGWLNGKTYNLINVNVPVHFKGERDDLDGDLVLAMFENHTDPIVGGRETMGYGKLHCDIPPIQHNDNKYIALASAWNFQFMKLTLDVSKPAPDLDTLIKNEMRSAGKMHYKYIPAVMEYGDDPGQNFTTPAIAYPTILPKWEKPDDYPYEIRKPDITFCDGTIEWTAPTWEDWPTFGNVGAGLASLKCKRVIGGKQLVYDEPCEYITCYRLR